MGCYGMMAVASLIMFLTLDIMSSNKKEMALEAENVENELNKCTYYDGICYNWRNDTEVNNSIDGYEKVSYIESTGDKYIDTGLTGKEGFHAEIDYEFTNWGTFRNNSNYSQWTRVLGYVDVNSNISLQIINKDTSMYFRVNNDEEAQTTTKVNLNQRYNIDIDTFNNKELLTIDGEQLINKSKELDYDDDPLYIFGFYHKGNIDISAGKFYGGIFYNKYGDIIRNFIPIKDENNKTCLYDTIHKKKYNLE